MTEVGGAYDVRAGWCIERGVWFVFRHGTCTMQPPDIKLKIYVQLVSVSMFMKRSPIFVLLAGGLEGGNTICMYSWVLAFKRDI